LEPDSPQPNPSQADPQPQDSQRLDSQPLDSQPLDSQGLDSQAGDLQQTDPSQPGLDFSARQEAGSLAASAEQAGFMAATLDELRRVVWPSRQQLFSESVAVILMVGLSAAAIAAIDRFYGWAATQVFR
jgi:preprotein translocase subunit SecE